MGEKWTVPPESDFFPHFTAHEWREYQRTHRIPASMLKRSDERAALRERMEHDA